MIQRSSWTNGNSFTFHHIEIISTDLILICTQLQKASRKNKLYANAHRLEVLENQVKFLNERLVAWLKDIQNSGSQVINASALK